MRIAKTLGVVAAVGLASAAHATYYTGFELPQYNASPAGVNLTGQQGWTASPVAGSLNFNVHTYAGNSYGFVQNPVGGNQFIAGLSGTGPARAQIGVGFSNSTWTVSYDMNAGFNGTLPTAANLGSFSLNHNTLAANTFQGFINLLNFNVAANPAAGWKSEFNVFDAAGVALNNQSPGAFFANLKTNNWYRTYVTVDFAAHQILTISIIDLHTGLGSSVNPNGWYLNGGAASTLPLPDALRAFAGGNAGNITGWDNINAVPAPAGALALAGGLLFAARRRRA